MLNNMLQKALRTHRNEDQKEVLQLMDWLRTTDG